MKMAESLATPRCFSSAPSICFNHMVTGKKNYPVHKASKIKKSVWVTVCGRQQCHRASGTLINEGFELQLGI